MRQQRPLLTCPEAAERLHVSESTLYRLRRSGVIPEIVVGKRSVRIDPDSVDAYIRGGEIGQIIREGTRRGRRSA